METAVAETLIYKRAGETGFMGVTPIGVGCNPRGLVEVATRTGTGILASVVIGSVLGIL